VDGYADCSVHHSDRLAWKSARPAPELRLVAEAALLSVHMVKPTLSKMPRVFR